MTDWHSREIRHRTEVVAVNPHDLDDEWGTIEHVAGSCTLVHGYYTEQRVSASVEMRSFADYPDHAFLRIYHLAGDERIERGTFAISRARPKTAAGAITMGLSLMSALGMISEDYDAWPMSVGQGARTKDVIAAICGKAGRAYTLSPTFVDYIWRTGRVMEAGKSLLSRLYEACSASSNRLDVDPHGLLTFEQYVNPADKDPSATIDVGDPRSIVIDGTIVPGTNLFGRPSRSIVMHGADDTFIAAQSDLPATDPASFERRGYRIAEMHELSDMGSPRTVAHAQQMARNYLASDSAPSGTWEVDTLWMPLGQGDVVDFAPRMYDPWGGGEPRRCLVQSLDEGVGTMKMLLKEV